MECDAFELETVIESLTRGTFHGFTVHVIRVLGDELQEHFPPQLFE